MGKGDNRHYIKMLAFTGSLCGMSPNNRYYIPDVKWEKLTTDVLVKLIIKSFLLLPAIVSPPNNAAVLLVTNVRVKSSIGGGRHPVTFGEIHLSTET